MNFSVEHFSKMYVSKGNCAWFQTQKTITSNNDDINYSVLQKMWRVYIIYIKQAAS